MNSKIRSLFLLLASVGAGFAMLPSPAAAAEDPAVATVYDPGAVGIVELTLSPEAIVSLEAEPDKDVKGTFTYATTDGSPGGAETTLTPSPIAVEVHLKGSIGGSFRPIAEKAGLKLKFKKTATFVGLRKMTLNNMVQDDSMIHEALAYATFAAAGVPSSRSGYAYVRMNGEDLGLYANVETLDKVALEKHFGEFEEPPQHLYEGEKGHDVVAGQESSFEVDEGDETDVSDLETLIGAVAAEGDEPWSTLVAPYLDLNEMTKMWAVEKYIDHWDGYSGHALAGLRPNNYYLYSDAGGRFQMLPWGTDQTYIPTIGVGTPGREVSFDGEGGVLFDKCLEDEACARLYWEALSDVTEVVAALDPGASAADTAALLAPWEQLERAEGRPEFTQAQVEEGVETTLDFIAGRPADAEAWLLEHTPPPLVPIDSGGAQPLPVSVQPDLPVAGSERVQAPAESIALRVAKGRGAVRLRLHLDAPGNLILRGAGRLGGRRRQICRDEVRVIGAGDATLVCRLPSPALRRLAKHALPVILRVTFAPDAGSAALYTRQVVLRRR